MASKYRVSPRKNHNTELEVAVSSLSKENDFLKKTLAESRRHYTTLNKLLERFLTLETVRLEGSQQLEAKVKKNVLPTEQLSDAEDNQVDGVSMRIRRIILSYSSVVEELKNKLVSVSARCQNLENKVAQNKQDTTSDEQALTDDMGTLQSNLKDALEKNKQWLEYDQQREAYVRAVLARMLWLEKQLNEANRACLLQHNEEHSDEKVQRSQMQEHNESLLQGGTSRELVRTQNSFREREEALRQQRQSFKRSREGEAERAETVDLRHRLGEEKRTSSELELQEDILGSVFKDIYKADQQKIAHLERQIRISSQDLEDERRDCVYLRKQIVKLLKKLRDSTGHLTKPSKREQQEVAPPSSHPTRDGLQSSPSSSLQDESWLECPICRSQYAAHQHRDLIYHLEVCHD